MKSGGLLSGLTRKNPPGVDKSMGASVPKKSVDGDGRGIGTAKTPASLGPRTA